MYYIVYYTYSTLPPLKIIPRVKLLKFVRSFKLFHSTFILLLQILVIKY